MVIDREIERIMQTFGRGLTKQDRELLNETLQLCTRHSQACSEATKLVPTRAIFLAVFLEQEKRLQALVEKLEQKKGEMRNSQKDQ